MDRRHFLAAAGGSGLALGVPAARAMPPPASGTPLIESYITNVAETCGVRGMPAAGSAVRLVVDRDRAYDRRSVLVLDEAGAPIGYLPRPHAQMIEPLLAAGIGASGRIGTDGPPRRTGVRITIGLDRGALPAAS